MSTERLRAKLTKAGYDEDEVFEMDRGELLSTYAEYLLSPRIPESPEKAEGGPVGGTSAEEWELELKRQKEERLQREEERRKQELEFQKQKEEKEEERRKQEFEFQKETGEGRSAERRRSRSAETA